MARLNVGDSTWLNFETWNNRGVSNAPRLTLPDNRIFYVFRMRSDVSHPDAIGRAGLTHEGTPDVESYYSTSMYFPTAKDVFITTSGINGNTVAQRVADAQVAASKGPLASLEMEQFGEGEPQSMANGSEPEIAYYYHRKQRYGNQSWKRFGTYGWPDWTHWYGSQGSRPSGNSLIDAFKPYYASQMAAQAKFGTYFQNSWTNTADGKTYRLADLIGANVSFYTKVPFYAEEFYSRLAQMELLKLGQGTNLGPGGCVFFPWYSIEALKDYDPTGQLHNDFWFERKLTNPPGTLYTTEHPQVDFSFALGCNFIIGFCKGDGLVQWDTKEFFGTDPEKPFVEKPSPDSSYKVRWEPTDGTTQLTRSNPYTPYPNRPLTWHDAAFVAAEMYAKCNNTAGEKWQYLRFRTDGGSWVNPQSDGSDVLYAAAANSSAWSGVTAGARPGRGIVLGRRRNNFFDYCIFDPSLGRHQSETYEVEITYNGAARQFSQVVQGGTLCVCTETL